MLHHVIAGGHGGFLHGAGHIVRTAGLDGSLIDHIDRKNSGLDCLRMRVEYHGVAAGNHADGIADNRLAGVGGRGDRADHAERTHL